MKNRIYCTLLFAFGLSIQPVSADNLTIPLEAININRLPTNELLRLNKRQLVIKPNRTIAHSGLYKNRIVLKFKEGTKFRINQNAQNINLPTSSSSPRLTTNNLTVTANPNSRLPSNISLGRSNTPIKPLKLDLRFDQKDKQLLQRNRLNEVKIKADLQKFNQVLKKPNIASLSPLFSRSPAELAKDRLIAERTTKTEIADLANYYNLTLKSGQDASALVDELNRLDSVEIAYLAPIGEDADIAPPTPDMDGNQGYLNAAPQGIDAKYAWTQNGGRGNGIKVIDLEQGWNLNHEDLRGRFFRNGVIKGGNSRQHGTAVLGVIIARDDNHGVAGIVNRSGYGVVSAIRKRRFLFIDWEEYNLAEAINVAANQLSRGDVIIIEQHARGPGNNSGCTCNCDQYRYIAMEYWQAEFDAIRAAVGRGIVVVEAAGNGSQNLDHSRYGNRFNRSFRDSGAILVGAGNSSNRAPTCWTNYGSRVDVQGWGNNVMTTGYGDVRANGNDDRQWYTRSFSGTSSASPIVAGAVASLQGIQRRAGQVIPPSSMRNLLRNTGTPQGTSSKNIGPLPDLKKAIARLQPEDCLRINPNRVEARRVNGRWKVVQGNNWLLDFAGNAADARKARNIIRHYRMTQQCFVGRPQASFEYFLSGSSSPAGAIAGEDCIGFNRANLRIRRLNNRWKIVSGNSIPFDFGNKRNEAEAALALINKHEFTKTCYVGRPQAEMTYLRR